jgi:hypothetical protein
VLNLNSGFRSLAFGSALAMAVGAVANPTSSSHQLSPSDPSIHTRLLKREAKFFENKGQWDNRSQYLTRRPNLDIWFENRGIDFDYYLSGGTRSRPTRKGQVVSMQFVGKGEKLQFHGVDPSRSRNDYLLGKKWVYQAVGYKELLSKNVFPGVNLRSYYQGESPRYDLIVAPHANPAAIKIRYAGADKVSVTKSGIELLTHIGKRLQGDLKVYQLVNGRQITIPASLKLVAKNEVGLSLGHYDSSRPLVVDPLVYGTYFGGDGGWDEVRSVVADSANTGGVYMTGDTQSSNFPVIYGPYFLNIIGVQNAFVAKLQGDAFNEDYAAFIGGSLVDTGQFIKLDPFGNLVVAGTSNSSDFPGSTRNNKLILTGDPGATGGQFLFTEGRFRSTVLPFNATIPQMIKALDTLPGVSANLLSLTSVNGLPINDGGTFELDFRPSFAGLVIQTISTRVSTDPNVNEVSSGLPFNIVNYFAFDADKIGTNVQTLTPEGSAATIPFAQNTFTLSFTTVNGTTVTTDVTPALSVSSTAAQIETALEQLGNIGTGNVTVTDVGRGTSAISANDAAGTIEEDKMQIVFGGKLAAEELPITITTNLLQPKPAFTTSINPFVFVITFRTNPTTVLSPLATQELSFGGAFGTELNGFDVKQVANPVANSPDDIILSGTTGFQIPEFASIAYPAGTDGQDKGFMVRMNLSSSGAFSLNQSSSRYVSSAFGITNRGVVLDAAGNAYVAGTVESFNAGNFDTSVNPVFTTTNNIFPGGRRLQDSDIFVQKYAPDGSLTWSGLLGGHANDVAGGWIYDVDGSDVATGSAVAVDDAGSVYVTGVSTSYDFPRTRGVFGEVFTDGQNVTITKISSDGTSLIYSTNLNAGGDVVTAGIAVDERGQAVVTGNTAPIEIFPEAVGQMPPTPPLIDQPVTNVYGSVATTSDAFEGQPAGPAAPEIGVFQSWVNVLSADATSLVYGSYVGGTLDNRVYGPYVDNFGDTWLYGWVETYRIYGVPTDTIYQHNTGLPASMLSSDAFKPYPDNAEGAATGSEMPYGFFHQGPDSAPTFYPDATLRDGWVTKIRIGLPSVQALTFSPATIPGGFGSSSTGTVTLSEAAPSNGALINISVVTGTGASFSSTSTVETTSITIPAGGTTGTFTVYSSPVGAVTSITIQANYLGAFQDAALSIEPYLAGFTLSPNTVVGGNSLTGTITLVQPAPTTSGVAVTLSSPSSLISFPGGTTVTVPAGQTTASVTIATSGVTKPTNVTVSAAVSSYTVTASAIITPVTLQSLTFSPNPIADGATSTGTLTLTGTAGSLLHIGLTGPAGAPYPPGFVLPASVIVPAGATQVTFPVTAPFSPTNTTLTVLATMSSSQGSGNQYAPSQVSGTLTVTSYSLATFVVSPTTIPAGGITTGTVTLATPAPQGGITVEVTSSNSKLISFFTGTNTPATTLSVMIPNGLTSATFSIQGGVPDVNTPVSVNVIRGSQTLSQTVTVQAAVLSLTLNPSEVSGGTTSVGTLSIPAPAPAGGLTASLSEAVSPTSSLAGTLPASITIPAGQTSVNFNVGTSPVAVTTTYTITATFSLSSTTKDSTSAQLIVDPVGIASISFSPSTVHGGLTTLCTITLQGPALPTGAVVVLNSTNPYLILPASITIPGGKSSVTFQVPTVRVSRDVATIVSASFNGTETAMVVVER